MWARWLVSAALIVVAGCHDDDGALKCGSGIDQRAIEGWAHVDPPATVMYRDNPPASGNHYPVPAPWGVAPAPVQREQWVHNLEHGGIVFLYNCPSGCDDDVQAMTNVLVTRPVDQFNEVRILITPDTLMPHSLAAIAWGWRWQSESWDDKTVECFIDQRYDKGREVIP
jgi:Protein of unknown function (DUF3105)